MASAAVDDKHVTLRNLVQFVADAENGRQPQIASQNGRVGKWAAAGGAETTHQLLVHLGRVRGQQILGHDYRGFCEFRQGRGRQIQQQTQDAAHNIGEVRGALAEIGIVHCFEHLYFLGKDALDRRFGAGAFGQFRFELLIQIGVANNHLVGLKDCGFSLTDGGRGLVAQGGQLL